MDTILKVFQCSNLGGMERVGYNLLDSLEKNFRFRITSPRAFGPGADYLKKHDADAKDFEYKGKFGWRSHPKFKNHINQLSEGARAAWVTGTCTSSLRAIQDLDLVKGLSHHYHHFEDRWSPLRWKLFYNLLARKLDFITYPTNFTRNEALSICPWLKETSHVVRNSFNCNYTSNADRLKQKNAARIQLGIPADAFVIGNAGWMIQRKRPDVFLDVAVKISKELPRAFFVYCGGGELEEKIKHRISKENLSNQFLLPGWVKDIDLHYKSWDVCLFNSDYDTMPCAPIEASTHGCNVVASLIYGGLSEFFRNGKNACMLDKHDQKKMVKQILALEASNSMREDYREYCNSLFNTEYSEDRAKSAYQSMLTQR